MMVQARGPNLRAIYDIMSRGGAVTYTAISGLVEKLQEMYPGLVVLGSKK